MPFSEKTFSFLLENKMQNSKEWFLAHKHEYQEYVLTPLAELIITLRPVIKNLDPQAIAEPRIGKSISRIYRDTRFSKDKTIFRDVMWCIFYRDKKLYHNPPAFFFEFSPAGYRYGCGYYQMPVSFMDAVRQLILTDNHAYQKAISFYQNQNTFVLEGDSYKKNHYPKEPKEKCQWLNRKSMAFTHWSDNFTLFYSDALSQALAREFTLLLPLYDFFLKAEETTRTLTN